MEDKVWYTQSEAAKKLKRSVGYVYYQCQIGNIKRKKFGSIYKYKIEDDCEVSESPQDLKILKKNKESYHYNNDTQCYVFYGLTDQPPVVTVHKDHVESIVRDYSNDTGGLTLNQVATKYSLSRTTVRQILSFLGKTHDSVPFTDEYIKEATEDDLIQDLVRAKEQRVVVKAQKKRMRDNEKFLDGFNYLKSLVTEISDNLKTIDAKLPKFKKVVDKSNYVVLFGLTDLHIGKRGVDGFNSMVASNRALHTIKEGKDNSLNQWGTPDYWVVTCGSDMLHVDNYRGTTEKGTPMDVDTDPASMMSIAYALMERIVLMLRQTAPVKIIAMTGNHDRLLSSALGMMLSARFQEDVHTEIVDGSLGTAYVRYGSSLLGFSHGDSIKPEKLANIMAGERPKDWGECDGNWEWFTGHRHGLHLDIKETNGCRVWTMPSLSGTDRWHKLMGYSLNRKQLAMFKIVPSSGVVGVELLDVEN